MANLLEKRLYLILSKLHKFIDRLNFLTGLEQLLFDDQNKRNFKRSITQALENDVAL